MVVARGPRARRLQAEFGDAVSALEAEEVMRYAKGDVELAGALLRNKLDLPRKRKHDGTEEAELSLHERAVTRLQDEINALHKVRSEMRTSNDTKRHLIALKCIQEDKDFKEQMWTTFKEDPAVQAQATAELIQNPSDELKRKAVAAIAQDGLVQASVKQTMMENKHLRDAVRRELRADDKLRDEVKNEIAAGIRQRHSLSERMGGAWREMSVLPASSARYDKYQVVDISLEQPVAQLLMHLLHGTRRRHRGLPPPHGTGTHVRAAPSYNVLKIERIINPRLQTDYQVQLDNIRGKHGNRPVTPLAPLPEDDIPIVKGYQAVSGSRWSERFLFHGAPYDKIDAICEGGLDHRRAGTHMGDLFGMGTYLAEDSSKSDIYAKPDTGGCVKCMLVCRACLGETYYTRRQLSGISMPPDGYDSITALRQDEGGCVDHREYVLYERGQALPEYRIYYTHAIGCQCSICVE